MPTEDDIELDEGRMMVAGMSAAALLFAALLGMAAAVVFVLRCAWEAGG